MYLSRAQEQASGLVVADGQSYTSHQGLGLISLRLDRIYDCIRFQKYIFDIAVSYLICSLLKKTRNNFQWLVYVKLVIK